MKVRTVINRVAGRSTVDGAGVHLLRVLNRDTAHAYDPFLMLDFFDSYDPEDYIQGFPTHPHRGIETITYLISGEIEHQDSLGNKDTIRAGESQWMTAGAGILHQEMPLASDHLLGVQLWLNLPARDKMAPPAYHSITREDITTVNFSGGVVRVLAGEYEGHAGRVVPAHVKASILDVSLNAGEEIIIPAAQGETAFLFLIQGEAILDQNVYAPVKTAALYSDGDCVCVRSTPDQACRFLFCTGRPLKEPIAWGGPIVMNSQEELDRAFAELQNNTFIKEETS